MKNETKFNFLNQLSRLKIAIKEFEENIDSFDNFVTPVKDNYQKTAHREAAFLIKIRKCRMKYFENEELIDDVAWHILLNLYLHRIKNNDVCVKVAISGSNAPATTALRKLDMLEERKIILSRQDPTDQRRRLIYLTPDTYESMTKYLNEIAR